MREGVELPITARPKHGKGGNSKAEEVQNRDGVEGLNRSFAPLRFATLRSLTALQHSRLDSVPLPPCYFYLSHASDALL